MQKHKDDYKKSALQFARACDFMPGGVNSPVRAFGSADMPPLFIDSAHGSKIRDIDGKEYIDYVGSWGPMILGHAHPAVVEAVKEQTEKGTSFGAPTVAETALAKKITAAFTSIEKIRMVNSGTEAVMTAVRLARAYTKKDKIIKMTGCYHGHSDGLVVSAGSGLAQQSTPSSAGVPASIAAETIAVPYNDVAAVKEAFNFYKNKIAAVLIEPVAANMGVVLPFEGYLRQLRELCSENVALLVFDEVITGFRIAFGGAQELYGVEADITCLGKIIGAGLPAAALGARNRIMDLLAPAGPVYQAGTLSGNPLATAAANATLEILSKKDCYKKLETSSQLLHEGLAEAAHLAGVSVTINRVGSIMSCFFTDKPVNNFSDVRSTNIAQFKSFFSEMLDRGIYLAPSAYEAIFVSLAHSAEDIEKTVRAARESFKKINFS